MRDYLVYSRGIDSGRITTVDGGCRDSLTVELWLVPAGASPPPATPTRRCRALSTLRGDASAPGFFVKTKFSADLGPPGYSDAVYRRRPPLCPTITVSCASYVLEGQRATFTAYVSGSDPNVSLTYNWTVSAGTIKSGQGSLGIMVDTTGLGGQTVTATVDVTRFDPTCPASASCTTGVLRPLKPRKFDEYPNITFGNEQARLDNFAIELQNDPTAQAYIIVYAGAE